MAARFVSHGKNGSLELLAVGLEVLEAACKQACGKGGKGRGKIFIDEHVGKIKGHEIRHGSLQALLKQVAPDMSEDGTAVFVCGQANGIGGETRDLKGIDFAEQSVLLDVRGEMCESDVAHVRYVAAPREEAAAADEGGSTVEEGARLSSKGGFVQNVGDETHLFTDHGGPFFLAKR